MGIILPAGIPACFLGIVMVSTWQQQSYQRVDAQKRSSPCHYLWKGTAGCTDQASSHYVWQEACPACIGSQCRLLQQQPLVAMWQECPLAHTQCHQDSGITHPIFILGLDLPRHVCILGHAQVAVAERAHLRAHSQTSSVRQESWGGREGRAGRPQPLLCAGPSLAALLVPTTAEGDPGRSSQHQYFPCNPLDPQRRTATTKAPLY